MAHEHKVTLGEMRSHSESSPTGTPVGDFVISVTVEPPVKFVSEQAAAEMGHHVLATWNAIGKDSYPETGREKPGFGGNHALISFTHEIGEGDDKATRGVVTGFDGAHPDYFDRDGLQEAFDIVLNDKPDSSDIAH